MDVLGLWGERQDREARVLKVTLRGPLHGGERNRSHLNKRGPSIATNTPNEGLPPTRDSWAWPPPPHKLPTQERDR